MDCDVRCGLRHCGRKHIATQPIRKKRLSEGLATNREIRR
jgi:hypothetical protein